jgi:DNA topoisomerase-3
LLVTEAEHQARIVKPPLLLDQTSAQQEASKRYDMDPDETLAIIQKLYEHKLVTYPRTGSRFISRDVLKTIKGRMAALASNTQDPQLRSAATMMSAPETRFNMRSVNDGKVTDHHALLIERTVPHGLSEKEQRIYDLIALRMLEAFAPPCEEDVYKCAFTCAGEPFHASHTRTVIPGWKAISGQTVEMETSPEDEPSQPLPRMDAGDALPVLKSEDVRGETKPRPLYTFESLLEAMKTAGKESDDDEVKAALKDIGIGTAATRAEILKTLMDKRKYIRKSGKKIVPTETGLEVYGIVKDMTICDVDLTGRWEVALSYIADGAMAPDLFDARIRDYTRYITLQVLAADPGDGIRRAAEAENVKCPLCGGLVKVWDNGARCTNTACGLYVNRTVFGKKLSESTVKFLLEHGKTGIVKGLVSQKTGKTFEARLKLTVTEKDGRKYGNATPVFDDRKPEYRKYSNK